MNLIPSSLSCQRTTKVLHFSLAIAVAKWSMKGDTFSCSHSPWPLIKENISRACPLLLFGEKQVNQHSSFWIALHYLIHSALPNIFVLSPKTCGEKCWSPEGPQAFSESLSILSICSYISKAPAGKDLQSLSFAWYCSTRRLLEEQERQSGLKCQELEGYTYLYISLLSDTASFGFVSALLQGACGFTAGMHCLSQERVCLGPLWSRQLELQSQSWHPFEYLHAHGLGLQRQTRQGWPKSAPKGRDPLGSHHRESGAPANSLWRE